MSSYAIQQINSIADELHSALSRIATITREDANTKELPGQFSIQAKADGAITSDQFKVTYTAHFGGYGLDSVSGNTLTAVIEEAFRRKGWSLVHEPVLITHEEEVSTEETQNDEEIPF